MTTESMGQAVPITQTAPDMAAQAAQPPAQPGAGQGQGGSHGGSDTGPTPPPYLPTYERMKAAPIWLLWKPLQRGRSKPSKVPFYVDGGPRMEDGPADRARLVTYAEAQAVFAQGGYAGLGIALGPDGDVGCWQGIDLDAIEEKRLSHIANSMAGYVELSPSERGAHAIGYGRPFASLGSNASGIEAYAGGRFFTVTERCIRDTGPICLADYVESTLRPAHGRRPDIPTPTDGRGISVDPKTITELRSALDHMRSDDRALWVKIGMALKELGQPGRGLWLAWSQTSLKFEPKDAATTWDGFKPSRTGYQAVFAEAQRQGWVNPLSAEAQQVGANTTMPSAERRLVGRSLGGVQMRSIDWLWQGWVPKGYVTLFAGETGAGKSTVLADITARVTTGKPWPGEDDWRAPERVLWLGSEDSIEEMTAPRLVACEADLSNVIEIQGVTHQGKQNTFSMQDDLEAVGEWLRYAKEEEGHPFAMLVIDPVTSYLPGQKLRKVDLNDAGHLRTILEPWLRLAEKHSIAIVCVTHFAKDTSRAMLHRVLGSAAFAQTCRSLCAVVQQPHKEDEEPDPHAKALIQVKVNLPEYPGGSWKFCTEKVVVECDQRNGRPITATRPNWHELDSGLTPHSMVGNARGPVSKFEATFGMWLKAYFLVQPPGEWVRVDLLKTLAIGEKAATERWWNEHSGKYLEKQNQQGVWFCRLKGGG